MEGTPGQFLSTSEVRARRSHKCCECEGKISSGEKYQVISGKWDDEFRSFKTCLVCAGLRDEFRLLDAEREGPCLGDLMEWLYESRLTTKTMAEKWRTNSRNRGGVIHPWMEKKLTKLESK